MRERYQKTVDRGQRRLSSVVRIKASCYSDLPRQSAEPPMPAQTRVFLCLQDNYGVLIRDPATGATAAIDAPETGPIEATLKSTGWNLTDILVTHHHADHTGGIAELKQRHR